MEMRVLVLGGAGYIGSHIVRELVKAGYFVVVLDNLSLGHRSAVKKAILEVGDISDGKLVSELIGKYDIKACMHFSAYSQVGQSISQPDIYYSNNVINGINLLNTIVQTGVKYFIFSSSAAVYGDPVEIPIRENHPTVPTNPYGETKLAFEGALKWYSQAYKLKYVSLRYFNAAGADLEGDIGEYHTPETHLIPLALQAADGRIPYINVYGTDYSTNDKTCIRDYIHVSDLAKAHLLALEYLQNGNPSEYFNLGNGNGYSVLEVIRTAEAVTGKQISINYTERRSGDPAILIASADKAKKILGWKPQITDLKKIIETAWNWHKSHPSGFSKF